MIESGGMMADDVRRANGTGSIRLRPDGLYEARLTVGSVDGRQKRRSFFGHTRAEAAAKMEAAQRDLDVGLVLAGPRLTVARYLRDWLTVSRTRVRPSTWARYRGLVENNIIPAIGHVPLSKLTPAAVERMLADAVSSPVTRSTTEVHRATNAGLSRRTAHHMRAVLRTALKRAEKHGLVRTNAAELADAPAVPKAERPILLPDQVRSLLVMVKGDRLEALWWLAVATGLREGELLGLRWRDIDFGGGDGVTETPDVPVEGGMHRGSTGEDSGQLGQGGPLLPRSLEASLRSATLRVAGQVQRIAGSLTWVDYAKTERSIRHIGIPAAVLPVLKRHQATQAMERRVAMDAWIDWGLVFTRSDGQPLYGTLVHRAWSVWRRELGVPSVRFHDLRHSAAALYMAQGVDLKTVQQVLGHASIRTTAETYGHVLPSTMRDAAQRVSEALAL